MSNETNFPKLRVADVQKMSEDEAYTELEKRGLLQEDHLDDVEMATPEEAEMMNSGCEIDSASVYKDMLIESIVIDENGVFIGDEEENPCFIDEEKGVDFSDIPNHFRTKSATEMFGLRPGETLIEKFSKKDKESTS